MKQLQEEKEHNESLLQNTHQNLKINKIKKKGKPYLENKNKKELHKKKRNFYKRKKKGWFNFERIGINIYSVDINNPSIYIFFLFSLFSTYMIAIVI